MKYTILNALLTLIVVALILLSYYFYIKAKIHAATEDAVNNAEQDDKTAKEKMSLAVEQIYSIVPLAFKPFLTKKKIEAVIQRAFDKIEEYAKKQAEKKDKK